MGFAGDKMRNFLGGWKVVGTLFWVGVGKKIFWAGGSGWVCMMHYFVWMGFAVKTCG